jgi:hypothetical protein
MVSPCHLAGNVRFPIGYLWHLLRGLLISRRTIAPPRTLTTMPAQGLGTGNEQDNANSPPQKQPGPFRMSAQIKGSLFDSGPW